MKQLYSRQPRVLGFVLMVALVFTLSTHAQTVTWQAQPFPTDSGWLGPTGQSADILANEVILYGRPARSVQTFSGPLNISFGVSLDARNTDDGGFWLSFIPLGVALDKTAINSTTFQLGFDNVHSPSGEIAINRRTNGTDGAIWGPNAYTVTAGHVYQCALGLTSGGTLSLSIDGQGYTLPGAANVPFDQYQLQMQGWQPGATWHVTNFTAVPEPAPLTLVGVSLAALASVIRRRNCKAPAR